MHILVHQRYRSREGKYQIKVFITSVARSQAEQAEKMASQQTHEIVD
jgi:hypothetical protein